jgi:Ulp1 family protease
VNVCFYDSLERARKRIHRSSTAAEIVKKVNFFFKLCVLHEAKYRRIHQSDADLLQRAEYKDCPRQDNGYDCGIVTVAVVLYVLEQRVDDEMAFNQSRVTEARKQLATALINVKSPSRLHICEVFRR